jgi:hypothetical protein
VVKDGECTVSCFGYSAGSAVGSRYHRTGAGQQTKSTQCVYSELQTDCV